MGRHQRTRIKHIDVSLSAREIDGVLSKVAIQLGFVFSPEGKADLVASPPPNIDEFTRAVFVAGGLSRHSDTDLFNRVREIVAQAFVDHVGA